jgi:hypothetical protein
MDRNHLFLFIIPALLFVDVYIFHIYLYTYKYVYIYVYRHKQLSPLLYPLILFSIHIFSWIVLIDS